MVVGKVRRSLVLAVAFFLYTTLCKNMHHLKKGGDVLLAGQCEEALRHTSIKRFIRLHCRKPP